MVEPMEEAVTVQTSLLPSSKPPPVAEATLRQSEECLMRSPGADRRMIRSPGTAHQRYHPSLSSW